MLRNRMLQRSVTRVSYVANWPVFFYFLRNLDFEIKEIYYYKKLNHQEN